MLKVCSIIGNYLIDSTDISMHFLLTLTIFLGCQGVWALEIEDVCDPSRLPYSSNPLEYDYTRCDASKGLYCNTYSRCDCYVVDSYYDYYYGRCLGKIGYPCQATPSFTIPCGENGECDTNTGFCQCREGYGSNYDRRGCSSAEKLAAVSAVMLAVTVLFGKIFL